jgi:voltage-gated potassium channel
MHPAPGDSVIEQRVAELPAGATRRLVVRGLLRASLTATVLVVLYFTLPITGSLDGSAAVRLVVGLLALAGVVTWQVRAVLGSRYPGLRAVEALAAAVPLFLLVFAAAYLRMADADAGSFSEPLSRTDALYFTVTVFSTVGFGDITPQDRPGPGRHHGPDAGRPAGRGIGAAPDGRGGQSRPATPGSCPRGSCRFIPPG